MQYDRNIHFRSESCDHRSHNSRRPLFEIGRSGLDENRSSLELGRFDTASSHFQATNIKRGHREMLPIGSLQKHSRITDKWHAPYLADHRAISSRFWRGSVRV